MMQKALSQLSHPKGDRFLAQSPRGLCIQTTNQQQRKKKMAAKKKKADHITNPEMLGDIDYEAIFAAIKPLDGEVM